MEQLKYRENTEHSLQRSLCPWRLVELGQHEINWQCFPLCHDWTILAASNICIPNNFVSNKTKRKFDLLHIWGFIIMQDLWELKTTVIRTRSPSGCIVRHSKRKWHKKNKKTTQLNTLEALEFSYKSALAGDQQDWHYKFGIVPTPVRLKKSQR